MQHRISNTLLATDDRFGASAARCRRKADEAGGAGPRRRRDNPKAAAPIDLTGYWVSIVDEDWRFRMVVPPPARLRRCSHDAGRRQIRRRLGSRQG